MHPMQILSVDIGDCNLPTRQLLLFSYSRCWSRRTGVHICKIYGTEYLTEYLTLFSWFALLVNQRFDSKEFEECEIWTMSTSVGPLSYEQIINVIN